MQKCLKCSTQFTWKDITKSKWFSKWSGPLECKNCKTKHRISFKTKTIYNILIMVIPVLLVFVEREYIVSTFGYSYLLLYLLWIVLMVCLVPFYARFNIEVEDVEK